MDQRSRPRVLLATALSAVVLATTGCATNASGIRPLEEATPSAEPEDRTTRVIVKNESEWTLRVYALVGGSEHYLGSLQGFAEDTFELRQGPSLSTADFRLAAKATGPRANYYSNAVMVERGDTVRWTVMRSFAQTRATIKVS